MRTSRQSAPMTDGPLCQHLGRGVATQVAKTELNAHTYRGGMKMRDYRSGNTYPGGRPPSF